MCISWIGRPEITREGNMPLTDRFDDSEKLSEAEELTQTTRMDDDEVELLD